MLELLDGVVDMHSFAERDEVDLLQHGHVHFEKDVSGDLVL